MIAPGTGTDTGTGPGTGPETVKLLTNHPEA